MYRSDFPIFSEQPHLVYLDSAATTQKPQTVLDAVQIALIHSANPDRGLYPLSTAATELIEHTREKVATFIGSPKAEQVVFTANATESFNLLTNGLAQSLRAGDEIVLSYLEHNSVVLPWRQLALQRGLLVQYAAHNPETGRIDMGELEKLISTRTKVISLSMVSNVYGTRSSVEEVKKICERKGSRALIIFDACQAAPHEPLQVDSLGADAVVFSGHKLYAPTGTGVLWGSPTLFNVFGPFTPTRAGGGSVEALRPSEIQWKKSPQRIAGGTPALESIAGLGAAIDYLQVVGWEAIQNHIKSLVSTTRDYLSDERIIWACQEADATLLSFTTKNVHPHDIADALGKKNICVRAGLHCAHSLFSERDFGYVRISFGLYNTDSDISTLAQGLREVFDTYHVE